MIRTHRCGLDRDSRAKLAALLIQIFTGIQTAVIEYDVARCSHLLRRYRLLKVSFAQNVIEYDVARCSNLLLSYRLLKISIAQSSVADVSSEQQHCLVPFESL